MYAIIAYGWDNKLNPSWRHTIQCWYPNALDRCLELVRDRGVKFLRLYDPNVLGCPFWEWELS